MEVLEERERAGTSSLKHRLRGVKITYRKAICREKNNQMLIKEGRTQGRDGKEPLSISTLKKGGRKGGGGFVGDLSLP